MKKYICKSNIYVLFSSVFLLVGLGGTAEAIDTIILDKPLSGLDRRTNYTTLLLKEVLKRTEREFGPFKIQTATVAMERRRLLEELKRGELVNVSAQPSQPSWESNLKAIKIPVDMGLQS